MALVQTSVTVLLGSTNTTPQNRVLAPVTTNNRFIRGVYATNTGAATNVTAGIGAAAVLAAGTNANLGFQTPIPANVSMYPLTQIVGQGIKALGAGSLNEVMGIAAVASQVWLTVVYADDL